MNNRIKWRMGLGTRLGGHVTSSHHHHTPVYIQDCVYKCVSVHALVRACVFL